LLSISWTESNAQCPMRKIGGQTMVKIPAFAVLAAVLVVALPASAQPRHNAVAHRGHNSGLVVDPNGLHAFALTPGDPSGAGPYDRALTGGGSAGYNAGNGVH
jgi:hypothetical protein